MTVQFRSHCQTSAGLWAISLFALLFVCVISIPTATDHIAAKGVLTDFEQVAISLEDSDASSDLVGLLALATSILLTHFARHPKNGRAVTFHTFRPNLIRAPPLASA